MQGNDEVPTAASKVNAPCKHKAECQMLHRLCVVLTKQFRPRTPLELPGNDNDQASPDAHNASPALRLLEEGPMA